MATLKEIGERVIRNLNREGIFSETPDSTQFDFQVVYDAINDNVREITTEQNFRVTESSQSISLVQGTTEYALPADFQRSESMFFVGADGMVSKVVQYVDRHMFESLTANEEALFFNPVYVGSDSKPLIFTIEGANVRIKPMTVVTGTSLLHKYYAFYPAITNPDTSNYFTLNYPRLLELGATYHLLDMLIQPRGDNQILGASLGRYEREKARIIGSEMVSKGTETIAISNRV